MAATPEDACGRRRREKFLTNDGLLTIIKLKINIYKIIIEKMTIMLLETLSRRSWDAFPGKPGMARARACLAVFALAAWSMGQRGAGEIDA